MLDFYSMALKLASSLTTMRQKEHTIVILRARWSRAFRCYNATVPELSFLFNFSKTWIQHSVQHVFLVKVYIWLIIFTASTYYCWIIIIIIIIIISCKENSGSNQSYNVIHRVTIASRKSNQEWFTFLSTRSYFHLHNFGLGLLDP